MNEQLQVIHELESIPLDEQLAPVIHGNPYPGYSGTIKRGYLETV